MEKEKYKFKLRPDMPIGFLENARIPELPAMTAYLKSHDGETFSRDDFKKVLKGFQDYLEKEKVPRGIDRVVREGLCMTEYKKDKYVVFCCNDGMSGQCQFGTLEKIVE